MILLLGLALCFLAACGANESTQGNNGSGEVEGQDEAEPAQNDLDYPQKPISMIVPFSAGGGTDATARALAAASEPYLGESIGIVNTTGGGGAVGMSEGINSTPDGHTITMVTVELTTLPHLGLAQFTYEDFKPVAQINFDPNVIAVPADSPYETIEDLVKDAKDNPGAIRVSNSGTGSIWHIAAASVEQATGAEFSHVPFEGSAPAITAALGNNVEAVSASPPEILSYVESGDLRPLAVLAEERSDALPDTPTFAELGIDATIVGCPRGIMVPKDTPDEIVEFLEEAFMKGAQEAEFVEYMETNGLGLVVGNAEEFGEVLAESHNFFAELIPQMDLN